MKREEYIKTHLDMMKKIDYYRSIQDDEKVNQWLHLIFIHYFHNY